MVMPGDSVEATLTLMQDIAIEQGSRFTVRDSGKTVCTGLVTEILA